MEQSKNLAKLVTEVVAQAEKSFKDGFQPKDLFSFIGVVTAIPEVTENWEAIKTEFKERTEEGLKDLETYIKSELKLVNPKAEKIAEAAIVFVIASLGLIDAILDVVAKAVDDVANAVEKEIKDGDTI